MATLTNETAAPPVKQQAGQSGWTFKRVCLNLHLYLGLASAIFLLVLGVTGAIIGFEQEIPRWLHPGHWYVTPGAQTLPEMQLIENVEQHFAPERVRAITISRSRRHAQVMQIAAPGSGSNPRESEQVFVNPYNGAILGSHIGQTRDEKILQAIHSFHLRIGMQDAGKLVVSIAGLILCFEVVFGLILWWRLKRATLRLSGSWYRIFFDLHNAIGIYAALFLLLAGVTGIVIGFEFMEPLIFKVTHSSPLLVQRPATSNLIPGATPISVDQAVRIARQTMPDATVAVIQLPANPRATFNIAMRVAEETSPAVHSTVSVDQYSGEVVRTQNYKSSLGYRVIRFNRSLHTGDFWGLPGHILMSVSSLVLVVMVITGVVIWWKKLAI